MGDEEKKAYIEDLIRECKVYNHVDYDDDVEIIALMVNVTFEEMGELIPNFDPYNLKPRQRLLVLVFVKDMYDNREKYQKDASLMRNSVSSILLKEIYGEMRK